MGFTGNCFNPKTHSIPLRSAQLTFKTQYIYLYIYWVRKLYVNVHGINLTTNDADIQLFPSVSAVKDLPKPQLCLPLAQMAHPTLLEQGHQWSLKRKV